MDAPKCRVCGVVEWHHVCSGAGKPISRKPVKAASVLTGVNRSVVANTAKLVANITKVANKHGKYADKLKRRLYMRAYMQARRKASA